MFNFLLEDEPRKVGCTIEDAEFWKEHMQASVSVQWVVRGYLDYQDAKRKQGYLTLAKRIPATGSFSTQNTDYTYWLGKSHDDK